jgi:hypothetical protein
VAKEREMIAAALRESQGRFSGSFGATAKLRIPGITLESKIRSPKINKNRFCCKMPREIAASLATRGRNRSWLSELTVQ